MFASQKQARPGFPKKVEWKGKKLILNRDLLQEKTFELDKYFELVVETSEYNDYLYSRVFLRKVCKNGKQFSYDLKRDNIASLYDGLSDLLAMTLDNLGRTRNFPKFSYTINKTHEEIFRVETMKYFTKTYLGFSKKKNTDEDEEEDDDLYVFRLPLECLPAMQGALDQLMDDPNF